MAAARDHAGGIVHVTLPRANDQDVSQRLISRCFPQPNTNMRVVELDEDGGMLGLSRVDGPGLDQPGRIAPCP